MNSWTSNSLWAARTIPSEHPRRARRSLKGKASVIVAAALAMSFCTACSYIERVREGTDLASTAVQHYDIEALAQIETERQRSRKVRCFSPLLTPAAISAASADHRLGPTWVDELLRDCPSFAAFLLDAAWRRSRFNEPAGQSHVEQFSPEPAETSVRLPSADR